MKRRAFAFLLIFALMFCQLPNRVSASTVEDPLRYGWQVLSQEADSETLLYAYTQLVNGISDTSASISLYDGAHRVSIDQMMTVMELVRSDYPEFFWLDNGYSYSSMGSSVFSVMPMYTVTGAQLETAQAALDTVADTLLTGLSEKSDYAIAKLLHDRLAEHTTYQFTENDQTVYGALVQRQAVCAGYASAYQYLLHRAGIPAWKVTGYSISPGTGTAVGHAWNMVCLDGNWYHTDVTWDDQGGAEDIYYAYFNVTTAQIEEGHTMDSLFLEYAPICTATAANYFTVNGGKMEHFDTDTVAGLLKENWHTARCFVTGDMDAFLSAWRQNIRAVASKAGITGSFSYGYRLLGREIILYIDDGTVKPEPPEETPDETLPEETVPEETVPDVTLPDETVPEETVPDVTLPDETVPDETAPGDFTGNGGVDNADVVYLLWHTLFATDYPITINGDLTDDGSVDNADVVYLLWHTLFPKDYPI